MKGVKSMKLGLLATAAVFALVGGLMVAQVSAQGPELGIGDGEAAPGEDATVELTANVPDGLGAWTVDISYDTSVATATDCEGDSGSVCNPEFAEDTVRVTGASVTGLDEESVLAAITFTCEDAEDSTDLTIAISVFADATVGDPQDISADTTVSDGSITCAEPEVVPPTNTPVIVPSGNGGPTDAGSFSWVIAALAGAGVAALAGFGALRMRTRGF
jgi:hypothetical protein